MQLVPITTNVMNSNPAHGEMYSMQHYVIKFVSDFWQVGDFLQILRFPPVIKLSRHDITEILLNVALNTILPTLTLNCDLHYRVYFTKSMVIKLNINAISFCILRFTYLQCLLLFHLVD